MPAAGDGGGEEEEEAAEGVISSPAAAARALRCRVAKGAAGQGPAQRGLPRRARVRAGGKARRPGEGWPPLPEERVPRVSVGWGGAGPGGELVTAENFSLFKNGFVETKWCLVVVR